MDPLFCVKGALQLITWVLTHGRAARGNPTTAYINTLLGYTVLEILIVGLDTNITKNHLNMFPEILNFFLNISKSSKYIKTIWLHCCGATEGSEQQHNQDLKEIYKGRRILEFITFYHNALHLTTLFTTMHCI